MRTRTLVTRCTSCRVTSNTASRVPATCWRRARARWGESGKRGGAPCRRRATSIFATRTRTNRPPGWIYWPARSNWCQTTNGASISSAVSVTFDARATPYSFPHNATDARNTVIVSISDNRTYHFQAEDEADQRAWMSVLVNCKERALLRAFDASGKAEAGSGNPSLVELQQAVIRCVMRLPGNDQCCDCSSQNGNFDCRRL